MGESKMVNGLTRRKFLNDSAVAAASIPFSNLPFQSSKLEAVKKTNAPLKILILGGTSFLGPHQIADIYMYISSVSVFFPCTGDDFSEERKVLKAWKERD